MKKIFPFVFLFALLLTACSSTATPGQESNSGLTVSVYYSPTSGCCGDWIEYLVENGYQVQEEARTDLDTIKSEYQIPSELRSCHTAIV